MSMKENLMRKDEFLQMLRRDLNGDVPPAIVEENIRYYDSYIAEEVSKGRSEEEVIAEIGDPRLIAKNIEDTTEGAEDGQYRESDNYQDTSGRRTYEHEEQSAGPGAGHIRYFDLNKWYWKLLILVVLFCVISLIFTVIGGIFRILSPILYPLFMIWLFMTVFRMFNRR